MSHLNELADKMEVANLSWSSLEDAVLKDIYSKPISGDKAALTAAYSRLCVNHAFNATKLMNEGYYTSAKALVRPSLDAYGRQLYVSFGCNDSDCDVLWKYMQQMASAVRENNHDEMLKLDRDGSNLLPYGGQLVKKLGQLNMPSEVPFSDTFKVLFSSLNSATHGGLSTIAVLLTRPGIVAEPEFDREHLSLQISTIALRAMSLAALLVSVERNEDALKLYALYRAIVKDAKEAFNELPPLEWGSS